jgi:hypothetical protein
MCVLFLDIDGVICTRRAAGWPRWTKTPPKHRRYAPPNRPPRAFDLAAVQRLNSVIAATGAAVVVTSMWRLDRDVPTILTNVGFTGSLHPDWRTDADGPTRGDEIHRWLVDHGCPPYAIVDDRSQVRDEQRGRLVLTDPYSGLQDAHTAALMRLLRQTPKGREDGLGGSL